MSVKVVSWNVNGLQGILKKAKTGGKTGKKLCPENPLSLLIKQEQPDILCLQEIRCSAKFAHRPHFKAFSHVFVNYAKVRKGYAGTLVASKEKPLSVTYDFEKLLESEEKGRKVEKGEKRRRIRVLAEIESDSVSASDPVSASASVSVSVSDRETKQEAGEEKEISAMANFSLAALAAAEIDTAGLCLEGRSITLEFPTYYLVNVYVPNSGSERLDWRINVWEPIVREYVKTLQTKKPVVLVGDLNCIPTELDAYRPDLDIAGAFAAEKEAFGLLLAECEMRDSFRELFPETKTFSWFYPYKKNRNIGCRLDFALVSEKVELETSAILLEHEGSDHVPISVTFKKSIGEEK